ncbi:hypothetical protein ACLBXM_19305, partial [Xanthobacteraceae bacterium A53D]
MRLASHAALTTRILAGSALALALAGCAGYNSQGTFGAPGTTVDAAAASAGGVSPSGTTVAGGTPDGNEVTCPPVTVRSGASTWQVPAPGGGLRAQGTFGTLARECTVAGGQMSIKVGIEGRVILGDKGTPGAFTVPVRVALVSEGPNPQNLLTKFFVVPVQVPANETQAAFAVVEEGITFPMPARTSDLDKYIVYVGFDSQGERTQRPARPRATTPAAAPRPAATAPRPAATP